MEKTDPEMDKVRFALESEAETEIEVGTDKKVENLTEKKVEKADKQVEKTTDTKSENDVANNVETKRSKTSTRKHRKVRHASSGGSSGDVFPSTTKCRLGSIKRRSRRATESSRTSDDDRLSSRRRRTRNLSQGQLR